MDEAAARIWPSLVLSELWKELSAVPSCRDMPIWFVPPPWFERKAKEDEARLSLDKSKFLQGSQLDEAKLKQNEELANLRADTAMAKSEMSAEVKLTSDAMKARDVNVLKGPRN